MGRRPIGKQAMTDAERQRRHRAKIRDSKPAAKRGGDSVHAKRIAELEQQLAQAQATVTKLQRQQQEQSHRQTDGLSPQEQAALKARRKRHPLEDAQIASLQVHLQNAQRRVKELELELAGGAPDVAKLIKQVEQLKGDKRVLQHLNKQFAKERDQARWEANKWRDPKARRSHNDAYRQLTPQVHAKLLKALHPDRIKHCSKDELEEVSRIIIQLKPAFTDD